MSSSGVAEVGTNPGNFARSPLSTGFQVVPREGAGEKFTEDG